MDPMVESLQHPLVLSIVLSSVACMISASLILLIKRLFTFHTRLQSDIEKLVQQNTQKHVSELSKNQFSEPAKLVYAEADIIRNAVKECLIAQPDDRAERQNILKRSLIDDLAGSVSKYLKRESLVEISPNVHRMLSDYLDRLQRANPAQEKGQLREVKTQINVISLNEFLKEFPQFLSAKPVPYSGILHAYFTYLINQYIESTLISSSMANKEILANPIDIIKQHVVQDIIEHIDEVNWDKQHTEGSILTELKRFEQTVLNPILAHYQVTELPAVPGQTRVDVRIHDVLGKQNSNLSMGTVLSVYRRGYQYVDSDTGNSKIMKKAAVYIVG